MQSFEDAFYSLAATLSACAAQEGRNMIKCKVTHKDKERGRGEKAKVKGYLAVVVILEDAVPCPDQM